MAHPLYLKRGMKIRKRTDGMMLMIYAGFSVLLSHNLIRKGLDLKIRTHGAKTTRVRSTLPPESEIS